MKTEVTFKNNGKLKLLIIVGTRPEIIRLATVIKSAGTILIPFWRIPDRTMTTT